MELVRLISAEWARGDYASVDWAHPAIELVGADGAVSRGIDQVAKAWTAFLEAWDHFATVAEEIVDADDDRVLAWVQFQGRGRGSGAPVADFSGAQVFTFRDRKVIRLELFTSRAKALEAAGLSE